MNFVFIFINECLFFQTLRWSQVKFFVLGCALCTEKMAPTKYGQMLGETSEARKSILIFSADLFLF